MIRQIHEFQKTALNSSINTMEIFQARMEKMMDMFWEQTVWTSERMGDAMTDWTKNYQEGCETLKKTFGDSFDPFGCGQERTKE
ncbi:hypothetical protein [Desulfonema ishimotonii]|nr:hypothetical protein [Desulfonema ishimotonii]